MPGLVIDVSGLALGRGLAVRAGLSGGGGLGTSLGTALTISGTPDTTATVGVPYSFTPSAAGGTAPRTFSLYAGALPAGLSIDAETGEISGTPTDEEIASGLVIQVTDAMSRIARLAPFTITVGA